MCPQAALRSHALSCLEIGETRGPPPIEVVTGGYGHGARKSQSAQLRRGHRQVSAGYAALRGSFRPPGGPSVRALNLGYKAAPQGSRASPGAAHLPHPVTTRTSTAQAAPR